MTAKDFSESIQYDIQSYDEGGFLGIDTALLAEKLKEFAKFHVEAALKEVNENVQKFVVRNCDDHTPYRGPCVSCGRGDNFDLIRDVEGVESSILNAYPLDNIK